MRAHLFQGADYYPNGFNDYTWSFATAEEAVKYAKANPRSDWWEVVFVDEDGYLRLYDTGRYG